MKLLYLAIYHVLDGDVDPVRLYAAEDLSSYWMFDRKSIREYLVFTTRTAAQRTEPGVRQMLNLGDQYPYTLHVHNQADNLCGCLVTDQDYPKQAAFAVISAALADFTKANGSYEDQKVDVELEIPGFGDKFKKYEDPDEADKLSKIQKDINQTQELMAKNIREVLRRGERLDDLANKSKDLSDAALKWAQLAEKNNSCCYKWGWS